ncbi:MAG: FkbM family methyltransferase [Gemmatimonadaceae bacterium]
MFLLPRLLVKKLMGALTRVTLGPHVRALIVTADNGMFAVDPEDYGVGRRLRMFGKYGTDELERLKSQLGADCRVLVVGAHVGTLAIPLARLSREVVAIEANPVSFELLVTNIALNSVVNCRAINVAASDKDETMEFLLSRSNSGGSKRVPKVRKYMYYYDHPETIAVRAVSLDTFLEEETFDVIVMDIEGSEYFALRGMQRLLAKCRLLVVEFVPHHLKNVSGATVQQFLSVITPHFSRVTIPSRNAVVGSAECARHLQDMYAHEQNDEGIMFEKI